MKITSQKSEVSIFVPRLDIFEPFLFPSRFYRAFAHIRLCGKPGG
jgi:hypothetical protein